MTTLALRRALLPALTLVLLAACDRDTLAPAAPLATASAFGAAASAADEEKEHPNFHQVDFSEHVLDRLVTFGCGPLDEGSTELVSVTGVARRRDFSRNLADDFGGAWRIQIQPAMIPGVGLRTGNQYVVSTQGGDYSVYTDDFAKGTQREVWSMKNLVTGEKYSFTYRVRWEMDAERNLVEHREEEKVRCVK